ncbi:MAG: response regulator [Desulfobacter sp.]|nr:MAG: response regulator [Desulfobacter sp.]
MAIMTFFSGSFCGKTDIINAVMQHSNYRLISDKELAVEAGRLSGMPGEKVAKVFSGRPSIFNRFTHEHERSIAYLRLAVAQAVLEDNCIVDGFSGMLIPPSVTHVLKNCIIADKKYRIEQAVSRHSLSEKQADSQLRKDDEAACLWCDTLFKIQDPWSPSLYDIIIPTDKMDVEQASTLILGNLKTEVLQPTNVSHRAAEDFILAAQVGVALSREGHVVDVNVRDGLVTLTINTNVLLLGRLEDELKHIAGAVDGVTSVETRIGKGFYQADIYRKFDFQVPSKVLLVDDEREFVQSLSERLQMRDMGAAVAYDGESALTLVEEEEPEVMILDLKMPGIDGIEVLKKVKATRPEIEVVILTGHGSDEDRELCMKLGAFAYLQKPVDIEELSRILTSANEKIRNREGSSPK